jgi:hypothetical protein
MGKKFIRPKAYRAGDGFGETLYDGAAVFGRVMALVSLIIGSVIGIILIVVGFYLIFKKNKYTGSVLATVKTASCTVGSGKEPVINCNLGVEYVVAGKTLTANIVTIGKIYQVGEKIPIRYDEANPSDVSMNIIGTGLMGGILIVIGFFVILMVSLYYYFVTKYKFAAATSGIGVGVDIISG